MIYREVARKLRQLGCQCRRQSKGSPEIWFNSRTNLTAVVPRHSGDMPKGTLSAVSKQLGIDRDEFDAA
jgi:predicted RNA binding protein YcfA (HicA-like mRNA interferase family)